MGRVERPALRGTALGALLRLLNPVMRLVLASPLHWPLSRWFALLEWTGRRTGRLYRTPVSYVREGSTLYVTTGDRWWRNLGERGALRVRVAGRWRSGNGVPVIDRDESVAEHIRLFRERAFFRRLAGIPAAADGGPDAHAVRRAVEAGRTMVRIELSD